jgi:hypothetical protein
MEDKPRERSADDRFIPMSRRAPTLERSCTVSNWTNRLGHRTQPSVVPVPFTVTVVQFLLLHSFCALFALTSRPGTQTFLPSFGENRLTDYLAEIIVLFDIRPRAISKRLSRALPTVYEDRSACNIHSPS